MSGSSNVLCVGSVAFDTLELRGQHYEKQLGGSASFFCAAASYFAPVRLVAVVGGDFPEAHRQFFADRKIALDGLEEVKSGKTFHWHGRYSEDLSSRTTLQTDLNVFADFNPRLPPTWADSDFLFLGNIVPALQLRVLEQVKRPKLIAMDTMNLWIDSARADLLQVLQRIDLLILNDEEARMLAGEHNLPKAARAIAQMGPRIVIVKRGDSGALLFHPDGVFAAPAYPLEAVVDPTGAGDTFAGGFMGYLTAAADLGPHSVRRAMIYGSVMASFCVEALSLDRLRSITQDEITARYHAFVDLTRFEDVRLGS